MIFSLIRSLFGVQLRLFFAKNKLKLELERFLFRSKRFQGIDLRRASRRYPAREQRNTDEQHRDHCKRPRIARADPKQQPLQQSCKSDRTEQSQRNANNCQSQSLAQHHSQNIRSLRAQRETNPKLIPSIRDVERHHAVNTRQRQQQCGRRQSRRAVNWSVVW